MPTYRHTIVMTIHVCEFLGSTVKDETKVKSMYNITEFQYKPHSSRMPRGLLLQRQQLSLGGRNLRMWRVLNVFSPN